MATSLEWCTYLLEMCPKLSLRLNTRDETVCTLSEKKKEKNWGIKKMECCKQNVKEIYVSKIFRIRITIKSS